MQRELNIDVRIDEDTINTLAFAEMDIGDEHFEATGRARRSPEDRSIPIVGEELATARALENLTLQVMAAAQGKIDQLLVT